MIEPPPPAAIIRRAAAWAPANCASTVASKTFAKSASASSTEGASTVVLVRLWNTSSRPCRRTTSATSASSAPSCERVDLAAPGLAPCRRAPARRPPLGELALDVGDDDRAALARVGERGRGADAAAAADEQADLAAQGSDPACRRGRGSTLPRASACPAARREVDGREQDQRRRRCRPRTRRVRAG